MVGSFEKSRDRNHRVLTCDRNFRHGRYSPTQTESSKNSSGTQQRPPRRDNYILLDFPQLFASLSDDRTLAPPVQTFPDQLGGERLD
jgi:hypothetical protein